MLKIDRVLRFLEDVGVRNVERVESQNEDETTWVATETFGSKTTYHVSKNPTGEILATGSHVYV